MKTSKPFGILAILVVILFFLVSARNPAANKTPGGNTPALISTRTPENHTGAQIPVLMLQDGAPDDITAAAYLVLNPAISVKGIVVVNGETHPSRALKKWSDYVYALMDRKDIPVVAGCDCSIDPHANAFPSSWRDSADGFWGMSLPEYTGKLNATPGKDLILSLASQYPGELLVVITGPLMDMALALRQDPSLAGKIKEINLMGGAVDVPGNIKADDPTQTNTTADWQIWVDPQAVAEVFASGIPMNIVPMDAVPDVEIHTAYADQVGSLNTPVSNMLSSLWKQWIGWEQAKHGDFVWIYDLLAAMSTDHPELFTWNAASLSVVTALGPDQGRLLKNGTSTSMQYASHADQQGVLDTLYATLSGTEPVSATTDLIAGAWVGTLTSEDGSFTTDLQITIQPACAAGQTCGSVSTPGIPCSGDLLFQSVSENSFQFLEQGMTGGSNCLDGGTEYLQMQPDGSLSYRYLNSLSDGTQVKSIGILQKE